MKTITFYKFSELSQEAKNRFFEQNKERIADYRKDYAHKAVGELKKHLRIVGLGVGGFILGDDCTIKFSQLNPIVDFDTHSVLEFAEFIRHAVPRLYDDNSTPPVIRNIFTESGNDFKGRTASEYAQIFKDKFNDKNYTFSMEECVASLEQIFDNSGLFTPDGYPCEICMCTDIHINPEDGRFWWNDNDAYAPDHFPSTTEEYAESVNAEKRKAESEPQE